MLIVLSPAKSLDLETPPTTKLHTDPRFLDRSAELIDACAPFRRLNGQADGHFRCALHAERGALCKSWSKDTSRGRQAVMAFNGDVYDGLMRARSNRNSSAMRSRNIRILSGLYGMLRPLDLIHPHRLEMGTRLDTAAWQGPVQPSGAIRSRRR
jgi:cytoplasmic iron level regulating protein YaaA (DUF328/UPF0246 family)